MYTIRSAGVKGLGVFANILIPRGTRIFSERPLLGIRNSLKSTQNASQVFAASQFLSPEDRAKLMKLSLHATRELSILRYIQAIKYTVAQTMSAILGRVGAPQGGGLLFPGFGLRDHVRLLSIFRSNAFHLGSRSIFEAAVFPLISRINHSCVPNAQGNWNGGLGKFNVHATRDIQADEELTLNYLHEQGAVRDSRQTRLLEGYGFVCECPACDLNLERGREGETGRLKMKEALRRYADEAAQGGTENLEKELELIQQFITLFEGDRIAGRELSTLYFEAAKVNEMLGKQGNALVCAERGLEIDEDCLGKDHVLYEEGLEKVQTLR